jgi:predicted transcriptional regulator
MPIKPRYAEPIMDGRKRVEFRKTIFAQTPTHVVVYASSPVKKVLGYFEVDDVEVDRVDALWAKHAAVGCIDEGEFRAYYGNRDNAVALGVGRTVALDLPMSLPALGIADGPPQSFMYLDREVLALLRRGAPAQSPETKVAADGLG